MSQSKLIASRLLFIFILFWMLLAINPKYRDIWIAENIILVVCLIWLIKSYHQFQFSKQSYCLIFSFAILQTIGAHYSYAEVPLGFWVMDVLDIQRNHYDRLVHFSFGFLLALPLKELMIRFITTTTRRVEIALLVLLFIGIGATYEILEWWYAVIYEQDQSDMFLGSQGDIWDAKKDVLFTGLGAWLYLMLFKRKKPTAVS